MGTLSATGKYNYVSKAACKFHEQHGSAPGFVVAYDDGDVHAYNAVGEGVRSPLPILERKATLS